MSTTTGRRGGTVDDLPPWVPVGRNDLLALMHGFPARQGWAWLLIIAEALADGLALITRASGGARRAVAGLDYDARQGAHSGRRDELEAEGGRSREEMAAILEAAEAANPRKNGKVALDLEIELPIQATEEQRRWIVERVAAWFEVQGCPIHWAIHGRNSEKHRQPHFHATVTKRDRQGSRRQSVDWTMLAPRTPIN